MVGDDSMVEVIDFNSKLKLMAVVVACIEYNSDKYVIYGIDRGRGVANIFVSKLVVTSEGYTFKHEFANGEKIVLDGIVKRIINKEDIEKDGFRISNDEVFSSINYFDIEKCYVATINKKIIKDIMIFYKLITKKTLDRPVVEVVDDKKFFSEGFVGNLFLIVFGIVVIVLCISIVVGVFL